MLRGRGGSPCRRRRHGTSAPALPPETASVFSFPGVLLPCVQVPLFLLRFLPAAGLSDKSPRSVHPSDLYSDGYIE